MRYILLGLILIPLIVACTPDTARLSPMPQEKYEQAKVLNIAV